MPGFLQAKQIVYKSEEEVRRALVQVSVYICFLVATTITLSTQHVFIFYFNQAIERTFLSRQTESVYGNLAFKDIVTIPEFWEWLQVNFLVELDKNILKHKNETESEDDSEQEPNIEFGSENLPNSSAVRELLIPDNYVLGVPKLRQIRVKENSCAVHENFKKYFDTCFADYSFETEDRQHFYKGTRYFNREEYKATPIFGNLLKYNGPGYMVFLGYTLPQNIAIVEDLMKNNWIDIATRLVLLEYVVYNADTHLFDNVKIMAEVLPTGGMLPKWTFEMVPLYTIWSPRSLGTLICAIVFYLLVVYYTSVEIQELLKEGFKEYFGNAQNYVDVTILVTAYIALTLTMLHPFQMDSYIGRITRNPHSLASLDEPCFWFFTYIYVMAVCVFMVWAKVFRFVGFNKTLLQFSTTLRRCFNDILGFAAMFFIVFVAFAIFGKMVFGSSDPDFSTFQTSIFCMVRMVLGDFPYERIEKANRVLGPIFCLTYVVLITFILLNMFLAIINETYGAVKQEIIEGHSALKHFLVSMGEKVKNTLKRYTISPEDPNKKEYTPTSSLFKQQDDTRSMFEYADVPIGEDGKTRRSRLRSSARSVADDENGQADFSQDLLRLTERLEVLEENVNMVRANMNRVLSRMQSNN